MSEVVQPAPPRSQSEPVSFTGSVGDFLGHLEEMGKRGEACVLVYQDREIGAFIPNEDFAWLRSMQQEEERAERPDVGWQSYSDFRQGWKGDAKSGSTT